MWHLAQLLRTVHSDPAADLPPLEGMLERVSGAPQDEGEMPQEAFAAIARAAFKGARESLLKPKRKPKRRR